MGGKKHKSKTSPVCRELYELRDSLCLYLRNLPEPQYSIIKDVLHWGCDKDGNILYPQIWIGTRYEI